MLRRQKSALDKEIVKGFSLLSSSLPKKQGFLFNQNNFLCCFYQVFDYLNRVFSLVQELSYFFNKCLTLCIALEVFVTLIKRIANNGFRVTYGPI